MTTQTSLAKHLKNSNGEIRCQRIRKKLLDEPEEVRVKVILHELLHLRYPNHGKMFKLLLDYYLKKVINS
ncbi:MAG: M48 family metallopeptidase [Exilispira sp.]|nr:M48 family metallopeptidase [Exilispira sp.]